MLGRKGFRDLDSDALPGGDFKLALGLRCTGNPDQHTAIVHLDSPPHWV
jgi:hypothetical protein